MGKGREERAIIGSDIADGTITEDKLAAGVLKVPASLCTYVISMTLAGEVTATPTDPSYPDLPTITTTSQGSAAFDIGPIVNAAIDALANTGVGIAGVIGLQAPATYSYNCSQTLNGQFYCNLVGLAGDPFAVINIAFGAGLTVGIQNFIRVSGIQLDLNGHAMNGIDAVIIDTCIVKNGDSASSIAFLNTDQAPSQVMNCSAYGGLKNAFLLNGDGPSLIQGLVVGGNITNIGEIPNRVFVKGSSIGGIVIWPGFGAQGPIIDNSGQVMHIIDPSQTGVLVAPAVATGPVVNTFGTTVQVIITVGATATVVTKNATVIANGVTNMAITVELNTGESLSLDQITNVSWTWWGI